MDSQIKPSETYNIRSSTEMVEDCIRGSIKIKTFCLLKSDDKSDYSQFGKISVDFLVAHDKINLNKIILGIPFMHQTNTRLHFHNNRCAMKCILSTKFGRKNVNLQLNDHRKTQLINNTDITTSDRECHFQINKIITKARPLSLHNLVSPISGLPTHLYQAHLYRAHLYQTLFLPSSKYGRTHSGRQSNRMRKKKEREEEKC